MTMKQRFMQRGPLLAIAGVSLALSACGGSSNSTSGMADPMDDGMSAPAVMEYQVTVTNLSAAQPFSPLAVVLHGSEWQSFTLGESASTALEMLAESGDNAGLLTDANGDSAVVGSMSGAGILAPGASETVMISATTDAELALSVVTMLVNTNDAITALNNQALSGLAVGESATYRLLTYDTGTEANSETADTVPGPAASGSSREGFNAVRDDVRDAVYVHAGVVTRDDGLTASTLNQSHRWDNPVAQVQVSRIQ